MSRQNGASGSLMTLDKRSKILLVVLAGVVVIAALYFLVLKKHSSSSDANGPVAVPSASASASAAAKPSPAAPSQAKVPATPASVVTADSTRDPFQPLPQESPSASASPSAGASPAASPSAAASSSSSSTGSHSVTVLSITGTTAAVSYDNGSAKSVKQGSAIAPGITVVKVDADSIVVSYNDKVYAIAPAQTVSF